MARERMVTRTVESAKVMALVVNVLTQETDKMELTISATIPEEKRVKYLQKTFDTDEVKIVTILSTEITETLYGMPEQEFIAMAKILPPRTSNNDE